jgi:hypothetical protein
MDTIKLDLPTQLPDHTQLPCEDGTFVKNFQEHPQFPVMVLKKEMKLPIRVNFGFMKKRLEYLFMEFMKNKDHL